MEEIGIIKNRLIPKDIIKVEDRLFKNLSIDSLIKIAILTIVAGYTKRDDIIFRGKEFPFWKKHLEGFLSYILNDRDFAPIKFRIKISNYLSRKNREAQKRDGRFKHDYNCVILFSGGFDSSSALLYALDKDWNPLLLWVGFGQKNEASEKRVAEKLAKRFKRRLVIIRLKLHAYTKQGWKEWSYIVPARNFVFATLGAAILAKSRHRINRIIMGVTKEEYYHSDPCVDKSPRFFNYSSRLFSKFYNKKIQVVTPLKSVSKAELAAHWKNYWLKKYGIDPHETVSCYFGKNCGVCNSCFKRSISFLVAGIGLDKNFKKNPFNKGNRAFLKPYIERIFGRVGRKTKFSKRRTIETLIAYKKMFRFLPIEVKNIINNLSLKLKRELMKEEKRLDAFIWKQKVDESR
jgi:7-cyano-7-deazaguanine synthase in queuosine biosynthesis